MTIDSKVTDADVAELKRALPNCTIDKQPPLLPPVQARLMATRRRASLRAQGECNFARNSYTLTKSMGSRHE